VELDRPERKITKILLLTASFLCLLPSVSCEKNSPTQSALPESYPLFTTHPWHNLLFDADSDGTNDYSFSYTGWVSATIPPSRWDGLVVECLDSNQVQNSPTTDTTPIENGVQISDTTGWNYYSSALAGSRDAVTWSGPFVRSIPQNLGIRLRQGASFCYGWVKLSVASDGTLKIFDYACRRSANAPILAGVHP
jgi:hypothetical protein